MILSPGGQALLPIGVVAVILTRHTRVLGSDDALVRAVQTAVAVAALVPAAGEVLTHGGPFLLVGPQSNRNLSRCQHLFSRSFGPGGGKKSSNVHQPSVALSNSSGDTLRMVGFHPNEQGLPVVLFLPIHVVNLDAAVDTGQRLAVTRAGEVVIMHCYCPSHPSPQA